MTNLSYLRKEIMKLIKQSMKKNTPSLSIMAVTISLLSPLACADWGVGLGIDNEGMQYEDKSSDIEFTAFFNLQYQGKKFNADKETLSYKLLKTDQYAVEVIAASKNRGFEADDNKTFKGMAERDPSIDVGGRVIVETGFLGTAVLNVTKDVHSSKGIDAGIKFGGIAPNAPHWTGERDVTVAAVGGVRYQSDKVVVEYFGVKSSEATADRSAYKGKAATTPFIGFEAQANLTPHITIDGGLGVSKTATSIKNSPLTDDKKYALAADIGFTYWF